MSLYSKMKTAQADRDVATFKSCYHEDWEFLFHSTGRVMRRDDDTDESLLNRWDNFIVEGDRCLYENDDILVTHAFITFPNGTKDAVMMVHLKKDGLLWRTETGSTPIPAS